MKRVNLRIPFPFKGVSDRFPFSETPVLYAPTGTMRNVRPRGTAAGRERGGQRPGLASAYTDDEGNPVTVGDGPIQLIYPINRRPETTGYELGESVRTAPTWVSRECGNAYAGNLAILRKTGGNPVLQRIVAIGDAVAFEGNRRGAACAWTGRREVLLAVNENAENAGADFENAFSFASWNPADTTNDGFGTPTVTSSANWFVNRLATFFLDVASMEEEADLVFVATKRTDAAFGNLRLFSIADGGLVSGVTNAAQLRLRGSVPVFGDYADNGSGDGSHSADPGAVDVVGVAVHRASTNDNQKRCYFAYNTTPQDEAMVGWFATEGTATGGLTNSSLNAVMLNGHTFEANGTGDYAVNYPRGAQITDIAVGPDDTVYITRGSTGYGWLSSTDEHLPDFTGRTPVTVVSLDAFGRFFNWEVATNIDSAQDPFTIADGDPELLCVEADARGCYVGGREIGGANVFALNKADGGVRWSWRSCAEGDGSKIHRIKVDPDDGHIWVVGQRETAWLTSGVRQGVDAPDADASGDSASVWKLNRNTGKVLAYWDIGLNQDAYDIDIRPGTGGIAVALEDEQ